MKPLRIIFIILFATYIPVLVGVTFIFPLRERNTKTYQYFFVPLQSTIAQINDPAQYYTPTYWRMFAISLAGNFFLFLPLGFFLRIFSEMKNRAIFLIAVLTSILIEFTQLVFHAGVCDIDDVILNAAGAFAGIWLGCFLYKYFNTTNIQTFKL